MDTVERAKIEKRDSADAVPISFDDLADLIKEATADAITEKAAADQVADHSVMDDAGAEASPVSDNADRASFSGAMTARQPAITPVSAGVASWLTVEHLLYGVILLAAAGIRFFALTLEPLGTLEAGNAWAAWLVASGLDVPHSPIPSSALLYSVQSLLFWLGGGSDWLARALPAAVGVSLVWFPWLLRQQIGRNVALILALLLAVDPWLVAFSRLAEGTIISVALGFLTLIGIIKLLNDSFTSDTLNDDTVLANAQSMADDATVDINNSPDDDLQLANHGGKQQWVTVTAISAGLLLVSGSQAWTFVPVLLCYLWLHAGWRQLFPQQEARRALALFAGAALLGATGWLTRPEGLGYVSASLSHWVGQAFMPTDGGYPLSWLGLRLLIEQPLLIVFGVIGLIILWQRRTPTGRLFEATWPIFLTAWVIWGSILLLLPGRTPLALPHLALALLCAVATGIDATYRRAHLRVSWRESIVLIVTLAILFMSGMFWTTALVHGNQLNTDMLQATSVIGLLAFLMAAFFAIWAGWRRASGVIGLSFAALLFLMTVSASWQLTQRTGLHYPDALFAEMSHPDAPRLAADIATLSAQRAGDAYQMPVQVAVRAAPDPILGWYLRHMRNLTWTPSPAIAGNETAALLVEFAEGADGSREVANYLGSDYGLRYSWLPSRLTAQEVEGPGAEDGGWLASLQARWTVRTQPHLPWMFYREIKQLPPVESVVLWVPPVE